MSDGIPGDQIKLVICSRAQGDCEGCEHSIKHEPMTNTKQEVCTDIDLCRFHDIRVRCI
jgi:hypothetical protein